MADDHDHEDDEEGRTTAPQSAYTAQQVAVGFVIALVGLALVFGVPFLLA